MGIAIGIIVFVVALFFISRSMGKNDMRETGEILIKGERINIKQRAHDITESIFEMMDFDTYAEEHEIDKEYVFSKVQDHFEKLIFKKCRVWLTPDEGKYAIALAFYYAEGYDDNHPLKDSIIQKMIYDASL